MSIEEAERHKQDMMRRANAWFIIKEDHEQGAFLLVQIILLVCWIIFSCVTGAFSTQAIGWLTFALLLLAHTVTLITLSKIGKIVYDID